LSGSPTPAQYEQVRTEASLSKPPGDLKLANQHAEIERVTGGHAATRGSATGRSSSLTPMKTDLTVRVVLVPYMRRRTTDAP
jgi:hypothetical protein